jgi:DJ-1 family protein
MPNVGILLAQGFEEMELVITTDILRRAGAKVMLISLLSSREPVPGSRAIRISPDISFAEADFSTFDTVVLPGGLEGTRRLGEDPRVIELLQRLHGQGKTIAAICAAPTILVKAGIATDRHVTSHPSTAAGMSGVVYQTARVVADGNLITSRAAGTTFEFAFALVEKLFGPEKVKEVNQGVLALLPG